MIRPAAWAGLLLTLSPTAFAVGFVHPAGAAPPVGYGTFGVTALVAALRTSGVVGESGGLVTLDSAAASVVGALDSGPSARVLAAPYEPGTLARTGASEVNGAAGSAVLVVPDAQAHYPGAQTSGDLSTVPPQAAGPVRTRAGSALARAGGTALTGSATTADLVVTGAAEATGCASALTVSADQGAGTVTQQATTRLASLDVGGVLTVTDLLATVTVTADGDRHTASATLTLGGASVAGQPVVIGNDGVTAVGSALVDGAAVGAATDSANAALAAAGISVHTLGGRTARTARSAQADTGGLAISLTTPALPGGVAGNTLSFVAGGVQLTELDAPARPAAPNPAGPGQQRSATPGVAAVTVPGSFVAGTADQMDTLADAALPTGAPAPRVAGPPTRLRGYLVAGRATSRTTTLLGLAGLQFFMLSIATLYAVVERHRRVLTAGQA